MAKLTLTPDFDEITLLRVLCFGMGAIGTYITGSLATHGVKAVFIEKKEILGGKKEKDLRIQLPVGEIRVPGIPVRSDLKQALEEFSFDCAILAVKSFDTPSVLSSLTGLENKFPPILCMQNGIDNEKLIAEKLGTNKVISGTLTSAIGRHALGDVRLEKLRGIGIETGHPLSQILIDWMNRSGLNARGYSSWEDMKWSKLLTNLLANASSAILDWSPARVYSNAVSYRIEIAQIREALNVMKALEYQVVDLPKTPVKLLISLLDHLPIKVSKWLVGKQLAKARGEKMPSFHIDLTAGKEQSEVSFLNGAVVKYGKLVSIKTPVNQFLCETLEGLTAGIISRDKFRNNPELIVETIKEIE